MSQVTLIVTTDEDLLLRHFGDAELVYLTKGREVSATIQKVGKKEEAYATIDGQSLWLAQNLYEIKVG